MQALSVSTLNEQIKTVLESSFERVFVEGELSRVTYHNSGHIYFTLKDQNSAISCVMFRGNATKLKFRLEEGLKVLVDGAITVYKPRGSYQINCFMIEPSGQGALALAYEQLKQKLLEKGYFNEELKKPLPRFPQKIALVTSATGAALQDMLRVANKRYRNISIDIYDVLVQGEGAAPQIAQAITQADQGEYDLIVIARGGGSMEDLWAFNEEIVADAVYQAKTLIVSAVGHEIDYLISDFVADLRAPTPSAAMEMVLPDVNELYQYIDTLSTQMSHKLEQKIYNKSQELQHLQRSFMQHSVEKKLQQHKESIISLQKSFEQTIEYRLQNFKTTLNNISDRFPQMIQNRVNNYQAEILNLQKMLAAQDPKLKRKKGFAQISRENTVVELNALEVNDEFEAQSDEVVISAKVLEKREIPSS
ncbi:MAG: exodeoxyribonuclease VII large subunit [Sulfurimonas sp.]